jgi:hypothetical protein
MPIEILSNVINLAEARARLVIEPARASDLEDLERVRKREGINAVLRGPRRSRQQEKWYRAFLRYVADGLGMHPDLLHTQLRVRAGKFKHMVQTKWGPGFELTSSIEMDDAEYNEYVQFAVDTVFSDPNYLPSVQRADVLAAVDAMVKLDKR